MSARTDFLAGTTTMVRFALRRDRARLVGWAIGLGGFMAYATTVLPTVYDTDEDLRSATELYADPVGRMLIGPGYGFDAEFRSGQFMGGEVVQERRWDLTSEEGRGAMWGIIDASASVTLDGEVGYGLFEYLFIG